MNSKLLTTRLSLRHLRMVIAVSEAKSIVGAAKRMSLSQPTITKAIREIESAIGLQLFERGNRGVVASAYGEVLTRHAKLVLAQLASAADELVVLKDGTGGRVVVGTLLAASARLLPRAIALLHRERPNLSIRIVEGAINLLLPALKVGEIDFVIGRLSQFDGRDGVVQESLLRDSARIVVRTGHPLLHRTPLGLRDLSDFPWILPHMETTLRRQIEKDFWDAGVDPPAHAVESVSLLTNRRLLLDSDYISIWPTEVTYEDCEHDRIALLPIELPSTAGYIGITMRSESGLSPAAQACIEAIRGIANRNNVVA
jgi:DNA-binding transcriptional LysR family regulator